MKKIAVTGASGFLGGHILNSLSNLPLTIVGLTRDKTKIKALKHNYIKWEEFDLSRKDQDLYARIGKPDVLIHLAWDNLPNYQSETHLDEIDSQFNFLKQMIDAGLKTIFVSGTCFEYGNKEGEMHEDLETEPSNPYALAKDTLRKKLFHLKQEKSFNLIWARLFYCYGEGQNENSIYSQFLRSIENDEDSFNMSPGLQLRDFLKIEDIASYAAKLAISEEDIGIINICSGEGRQVQEIVKSWKKEFNSNIFLNLGYYPYPEYEPFAFWGNNTKLQNFLDSSK